ncbi:MAG: hypothetical protein ACI4C3_00060 [Bacteroides sp.]
MKEREGVTEVFDTRDDGLKCVRFESGAVGVVDGRGEVIYQFDKFKQIEFVDHDFVKLRTTKVEALRNPELRFLLREDECSCPHIFYVDMKSGQMYGSMPKLHRYGGFEVLFLCKHVFTRTKPCFSVETHPSFVWPSDNGLFLQLPCHGTPENDIFRKMLYRQSLYYRCLIKGDEGKVYWLEVKLEDESVVVMDDEGEHYYVRLDKKSGKAVWRELGKTGNSAERSVVNMVINDINVEVRNRMLREKEEEQKAAARNRRKRLNGMTEVVPFQIGKKWGLKDGGRIVVPPMFRNIHTPVGKYCAVEVYPGMWGVIAVDGKVEIEARYEGVELRPDGTVDLMVYGGKVISRKLP